MGGCAGDEPGEHHHEQRTRLDIRLLIGSGWPLGLRRVARPVPVRDHRRGLSVRVDGPRLNPTDLIFYDFDLEDYLRHEFRLAGRRPWPAAMTPLEFWSTLL